MYEVDICDKALALFYVVRKENLFVCDKALLLYDVIWLQDDSQCISEPLQTYNQTFHIQYT